MEEEIWGLGMEVVAPDIAVIRKKMCQSSC